MRWICEQEGIQADDETLGILARVGEGSVRDSLSALDQAIACCGNVLNPGELRSLMGLFSVDSLGEVSSALLDGDSQRMLEIVQELERNGRSLHHFCRELSRYFRNLLVARISGGETKLIGASAAEQERLRETANKFSEEDLTRYLHLSLELFKDIQTSLQPRLHLEMGLLRLVHAGKLLPIEQALTALKTGSRAGCPAKGLAADSRRATASDRTFAICARCSEKDGAIACSCAAAEFHSEGFGGDCNSSCDCDRSGRAPERRQSCDLSGATRSELQLHGRRC